MAILAVTGAVLQGDGKTVRLTTASQSPIAYSLEVINVTDIAGNLLNSSFDTAAFTGDAFPRVTSATATDSATIRVVFNKAMSDTGLTTNGNYAFTSSDATITVASVAKFSNTTVDITISGEMKTGTANYNVGVINVKDSHDNLLDSNYDDAYFNGLGVAPRVSSAATTGATTVRVTFNEPMSDTGLTTSGNYSFSSSDATITVGTVSKISSTIVDITTVGEMHTGIANYRVTVINVKDAVLNTIDASYDEANFNGWGIAPVLFSAVASNTTTVRIVFDSAMSDTGLTTNGNYSFASSDATITVASVSKFSSTTVDITIAGEMKTGTGNYHVTVIDLTDMVGNEIDLDHDTESFNGVGVAPRVLSATPVDNTHIDVLFDENVTESIAETITNYTITIV